MNEPKEVRRYLRRSFRPLGWSLVGYYLLMNILVVASMAADAAMMALDAFAKGRPVLPQQKLMEAVSANAWGYLLTIAVGMLILLAWKGWDFFRYEVFERNRKMKFSPFAALTGFDGTIEEEGRLTDRRIELDEAEKELLNEKLQEILEHIDAQPQVTITHFVYDQRKAGGAYISTTGRVKKIDTYSRAILFTDGTAIPVSEIVGIFVEQ